MALTVLNAATQGVPSAPYRSQGPVGAGPDSAVLPASRWPPAASPPPLDPAPLLEPELPLEVEPVLPSEPSLDPELLAAPELVPLLDPEPPEPVVPRLVPPEFEDEQASANATVPRASATRGRSRCRRRWRRMPTRKPATARTPIGV
jgi:hypothetical protein